jgi:phenylalanyl-tRNA synthetase beta chain
LNISLNWLRDFVPWDGTADELAERLTINGLNVESVTVFELAFPGVVVAKVLKQEKHPNADKLSLCEVDDGEGIHQVVCGAPNVRAGLSVLFARLGCKLPNGVKLKKTKIRGIESRGMICSASELGLSDDSEGIMELADAPRPGTPADELYGYRDSVLDIEVTPNRPDWLSHMGVAREVAAINGALMQTPAAWSPPSSGGRLDFTVEIENFDDCARYTAHVARGLTVGESPRWLRNRLLAVGVRPINNIVDITNYVLFETGQPLHAFDLKKLSGNRLVVRRAVAGETLATLDGETRKLDPDELVIADGAAPVALAGVMGGANSEVEDATVEVLLESAYFDPGLVRRSSRRHQLISESSYRFERGGDWDAVEYGARRAMQLFQEIAGGHVEAGYVDRQNPDRKDAPPVTLRVAQVNRLLGTAITTIATVEYLQSIGLPCQPVGKVSDRADTTGKLMVEVPAFRRDIHEEVDLIEEVARVYGFDTIEAASHFRGSAHVSRRRFDLAQDAIRDHLAAVGYNEIVTSTFMARKDLDRMGVAEDDSCHEMLAVDNPHHGGETLLRSTLVPSLLATARHNLNADYPAPFRLFQIGTAFLPAETSHYEGRHKDGGLLPREATTLQLAVVGRSDTLYGDIPADILELKGAVSALCDKLRVDMTLTEDGNEPYLQAGMQWTVRNADGEAVGIGGAVSRRCLRAFEIDTPVAMIEIDLKRLDLDPAPMRYRAFSRFPAVKRDLSLVTPSGVTYAQVRQVVETAGGPLLAHVDLFDFFRGGKLETGSAALGIRLKFQSAKSNLKGKAVDKAIDAIVGALQEKLAVQLRG